jgi:hypothetical protein
MEVTNDGPIRFHLLDPLGDAALDILRRNAPPSRVRVDVAQITDRLMTINCLATDYTRVSHRAALRVHTAHLANLFVADGFKVEVEEVDEEMKTLRVWIDGREYEGAES